MPSIRLYHATCRDFGAFDEASIGRGGDPNSALGIHLAGCPADTLRYVQHANWTKGYKVGAAVLVVEADVSRALVAYSSNDFFGTDEIGNYAHDAGDFAAARQRLIAAGFDAVCTEGGTFDEDGGGVWVVLDPASLRIVGRMSPEEAEELDACEDLGGAVEFVGGTILEGSGGPAP